MPAKLFCQTGKFKGLEHTFDSDVSIGRAKDNGVQLDANGISGYHARIHYDKDLKCYTLADTNSRNGTRLDGQRVKQAEVLEDLHIISLAGKHDLIFQDLTHIDETVLSKKTPPSAPKKQKPKAPEAPKQPTAPAAPSAPTQAVESDKTMVEGIVIPPPAPTPAVESDKTMVEGMAENIVIPPPAPSPAVEADKTMVEGLVLPPPIIGAPKETNDAAKDNVDADRTIAADANFAAPPPIAAKPASGFKVSIAGIDRDLEDGEYSIGRVEGNDFVVNENSMSRKHAILKITGNKATIKDLGSKNGVHVDGAFIKTETAITPNSNIVLGDVTFSLQSR